MCIRDRSKNARSDDNEEVLKNRLNIYHESTEMIKPYYLEQKKLVKIDGMRSIEQVSSDIEGQLINIEKCYHGYLILRLLKKAETTF